MNKWIKEKSKEKYLILEKFSGNRMRMINLTLIETAPFFNTLEGPNLCRKQIKSFLILFSSQEKESLLYQIFLVKFWLLRISETHFFSKLLIGHPKVGLLANSQNLLWHSAM